MSAKNARARADRYYSLVVRSIGRCERCNRHLDPSELQCAHIIRRRYSRTRTMQGNAWALCGLCHLLVDTRTTEFVALVDRTIGRPRLEELERLAHDDSLALPDWEDEAAFWLEMWRKVRAA